MPKGVYEHKRRSIIERFREKLPPESERDPDKCMEWQGGLSTNGYGQILGNYGRKVAAHRFAWEFATGRKVPEGMQVNHHCDNRKCVNPFHVYLGTQSDNARDMFERGRARAGQHGQPCGEAHARAKVPDDLVREAVALVKEGMTQAAATRMIQSRGYECHQTAISQWITGKTRQSAFNRPEVAS